VAAATPRPRRWRRLRHRRPRRQVVQRLRLRRPPGGQKEQGDKIQAKDVEPNPDGSNRKELLDGLADEGYGLIFGIGFLFSEDIAKSAAESPDTQFAVIDGFDKLCTEKDKNLLCIGFQEEQGSFLVGAAAALKTKSNTVGFVGGQQGQGLIEKFQAGYEAGVKYIADQDGKKIKVLVDYAGNTPEAFRNPAKGKELALKQIGQGADVIYHASGGTGAGVIATAADEEDLRHRRRLRPEPDRQPGRAEVDPHLDAQAGRQRRPADHRRLRERHREGRHQDLRAQGGRIDYAQNQYNKELLGDIPTTLDELKQKIIDGEIKVPTKPA
jgi:basic membrane protein A